MNPVYIVDSIRTPRARANKKGGLNKLNPYAIKIIYKPATGTIRISWIFFRDRTSHIPIEGISNQHNNEIFRKLG